MMPVCSTFMCGNWIPFYMEDEEFCKTCQIRMRQQRRQHEQTVRYILSPDHQRDADGNALHMALPDWLVD